MAETILLTGATGFLGSHLLAALLEHGYKVVILKRSTSALRRIEHLLNQADSYDLDREPLARAFTEHPIDAVVHAACHYGRGGGKISEVVETNLMFGLRLLETAVSFKVPAFLNTDTLLAGDLNAYALSKKQFVQWLERESDQIQVVNLQLEQMYGPGDDGGKLVPWVIAQLAAKAPEIKLTKGEQFRDFVYIDDVVAAYLTILRELPRLPSGSRFDVGTGTPLTVRSFVESLQQAYEQRFGKTATRLNFGAIPYRAGELMAVQVDNGPLRALGWRARVNPAEGLRRTMEMVA
ncbi:NAD-dependent epimerase/dehydratase family protein [Desulfurivibrio sp. D14AmB]|uniref:NAD-dependent epimerase/dehydratase family protein n=1 Tax=Desulfurivibrio sp. D14AmB TaxID=3374370 RepID=UPI00376EF882